MIPELLIIHLRLLIQKVINIKHVLGELIRYEPFITGFPN